jgi:sugar lactone lactonase YvrE
MRRKLAMAAVLTVVLLVALATAAATARAATAVDDDYVLKVLVRGAPLHEANGIWAAGGRLYVATVAGAQVAVLDARNGHLIDRLSYSAADDVTMGPDGSLYWTDLLDGKVWRMAPDGDVTSQFVGGGMNPIAFSADGRLFAAQAILPLGQTLFELDPALAADPKPVWDPGAFPLQLNGFDFGPDGLLYAPQPYLGRVIRLDLSAHPVQPQVVATGMSFPTAVKFDSRGRLFAVASAADGQVFRIDVASGALHLVSTVPTGASGLDNLAFGSRDELYCTGGGDGSVWRIMPSGEARNLSPGGMGIPTTVATAPGSGPGHPASLYVGNVFGYYKFDARTGHAQDVQWMSFGGSTLTMPFTLAAFGDDLVLTSYFANSVQVWDPATTTSLGEWFDLPVPLNAVGFGEDLVVCTIGTGGAVVRQTPGGVRTSFVFPPSPPAPPLLVPSGLAATGDDLWVADWATGVVWQLVADGVTLTPARPIAFGLSGPEGLAVDRDGSLLVVEGTVRQLTRIDPATGATTPVATGLRLGMSPPPSLSFLPFMYLSGVTVDARGNIYVTGDEGSLVYRLKHIPRAF